MTRSAPVSLVMMAGGAVTTTGKLAAGSTIAFAGPEISEQQELNPEQSQLKSIINGLRKYVTGKMDLILIAMILV